MKPTAALVAILMMFHGTALALSEKAQEAITRLEAAVNEEIKAEKQKEGQEISSKARMRTYLMPQLKSFAESTDAMGREDSLATLMSNFTHEGTLKCYAEFLETVRTERKAREAAAQKEHQEFVTRAENLIREAKSAADLDGIITELRKYSEHTDRRSGYGGSNAFLEKIQTVFNHATTWQNYLSARKSGNLTEAESALQGLLSTSSNGGFVLPRSQLLELKQALKDELKQASAQNPENVEVIADEAMIEILKAVKSPADLSATLQKLVTLRRAQKTKYNYSSADTLSKVIDYLQPLEANYQEFKAGLRTSLDLNSSSVSNVLFASAELVRIKSSLILEMLPRYIGAPPQTTANEGEKIPDFLKRMMAEAKTNGDVQLGLRAREALRLISRGMEQTSNDSYGLTSYGAGKNQEAAGQWMLAVISYQTALKSGSDLLPADLIGERLAAIKTSHPQDFEKGMELFVNPPRPSMVGSSSPSTPVNTAAIVTPAVETKPPVPPTKSDTSK